MRSPMLAAALLLAALNCDASRPLAVTSVPVTVDMTVAGRGALVLHLDDLRVASGESAMLRLFINAPSATARTSTRDASCLQDLYLVPSRAEKGGWSKGQNFAIPLPQDAPRGEHITLTIIPIEAGPGGEMNASGSVHVTLKRPYVTAGR